jgi:hypothetical protein
MINVRMDVRQFTKDLDALATRQIPYTAMKAINYTALDVQLAEQEHVARSFTLRRPEFVMNTVKIQRGNFATKDNLRAIVEIDRDRNFLTKFEDGKDKIPSAAKSIAIPIEAKRSKMDIVTMANRPKGLMLQTISARSSVVAKGLKRTFLIQSPDGTGGIYQRVGRGVGSTVKLLYSFKPRVPIPKRLGLVDTAKRTFASNWMANWQKAFAEAMLTAR